MLSDQSCGLLSFCLTDFLCSLHVQSLKKKMGEKKTKKKPVPNRDTATVLWKWSLGWNVLWRNWCKRKQMDSNSRFEESSQPASSQNPNHISQSMTLRKKGTYRDHKKVSFWWEIPAYITRPIFHLHPFTSSISWSYGHWGKLGHHSWGVVCPALSVTWGDTQMANTAQ